MIHYFLQPVPYPSLPATLPRPQILSPTLSLSTFQFTILSFFLSTSHFSNLFSFLYSVHHYSSTLSLPSLPWPTLSLLTMLFSTSSTLSLSSILHHFTNPYPTHQYLVQPFFCLLFCLLFIDPFSTHTPLTNPSPIPYSSLQTFFYPPVPSTTLSLSTRPFNTFLFSTCPLQPSFIQQSLHQPFHCLLK